MQRAGLVTVLTVVLAGTAMGKELVLEFELDARRKVMLVRGEVNGKPATLMVDTGATYTVLSEQAAEAAGVNLAIARFRAGPGFRGEAAWGAATLQLGEKTWRERRVVLMNLEEVSEAYGRRIDGIVGQDLLREYERVVIDFRAKRIVLGAEEKGVTARKK
jgi:hypothetical protein